MSRKLAELLLNEKVIPQKQFAEVEAIVRSTNKSFIRTLIEKRYISEQKLLYFLSQKFGIPSINLARFTVPDDVLKTIPADMAKKAQMIPIQNANGTLVCAVCDPTVIAAAEPIKAKVKLNVDFVITTYSAFDAAMTKHYGSVTAPSPAVAAQDFALETMERTRFTQKQAAPSTAPMNTPGRATGGRQSPTGNFVPPSTTVEIVRSNEIDRPTAIDADAPVIALVNGLFAEAVNRKASDIHIEAFETRVRARMRIDGELVEIARIPIEMKRATVARLKVIGQMDISESRLPQDGRIKLKVGGKTVDIRMNTVPTIFGEKICCRLLDQSANKLELAACGFEPEQLNLFKKGIYSPNGMVLVTGPTGSGKTTTLYSALATINDPTTNISTAEDPVEYNFDGINQVEVKKDIGLTFANVLRAFLRQDPDIILVGEIRDKETAEVAVQASLTGHLVLSTLHTNDAPSTIIRMTNMGVEAFLVCAAVNTIVNQRLVRKICSACKTPHSIPAEKLLQLGFPEELLNSAQLFVGRGCAQCSNSGYSGRLAIHEVLDFNRELKEMVLKNVTAIQLKQAAIDMGMRTLRTVAMSKVAQGLTTIEEALSATMEG